MYNQTMQGALIVFGGTQKARIEKIKTIATDLGFNIEVNSPDLLVIRPDEGANSIGIGESRVLINFFTQKPFSSDYKAAVILNAEKLTIQAQNALLKTMEEPPDYATIILEVPSEKAVLDTVLSRCKRVEVKQEVELSDEDNISDVINLSKGERISWVIEFSKKEKSEILAILDNWIAQERDKKRFKNIDIITKVKGDLSTTNLNTRLALEYLVLNLNH